MTASPIATTGDQTREAGNKGAAARFQWEDPLLLED